MQRFITLLFSIYLTSLAIMPCADGGYCNSISKDNIAHQESSGHSDHDQKATHCTPFCVCTCCGQTCGISSIQSTSKILASPIVKVFTLYSIRTFTEVFFNIWQPPKID